MFSGMKKSNFKENFTLLNKHIKRHSLLMIIAASIITVMAGLYTVYWEFDPNDISTVVDGLYLGGNVFFFVISVLLLLLLIVAKYFTNFKTNILAILIHVYVFLLIAWSTMNCIMDLRFGFTPILYLLIFTLVAGLFVVEPLFFGITILSSVVLVFVFGLVDKATFFSGSDQVENYINFFVFIGVILLVGGEHYGITINDYKIEKRLKQLTYYDDLTGLLNERSYLEEIEKVDLMVEQKE